MLPCRRATSSCTRSASLNPNRAVQAKDLLSWIEPAKTLASASFLMTKLLCCFQGHPGRHRAFTASLCRPMTAGEAQEPVRVVIRVRPETEAACRVRKATR